MATMRQMAARLTRNGVKPVFSRPRGTLRGACSEPASQQAQQVVQPPTAESTGAQVGRAAPNPSKRRAKSLSLSASHEEEQILREAAANAGVPFSECVRVTLFRAIGRPIPVRR